MAIPDHVRRLREKVGTELLLLPSATLIVRDGDGRLLLVRHAATGAWGLIGGVIEIDERPEVAARREASEEAAIDVGDVRLVAALGGPECRVDYPNGDQVGYVSMIYETIVDGADPRPDGDETTEVGWFEPPELTTIDLGSFARWALAELGVIDLS
jgi:ADP-ribose pyrophosphatase YjhB (NUDIX family)